MRFGNILEARALARKPGRDLPHQRRRYRLWDALKSACVGLLLLLVVVSAIVGAEAVLLFTVLAAWLLFPLLVGLENTLDAGCAFMLISLGVVVVVWFARNGGLPW